MSNIIGIQISAIKETDLVTLQDKLEDIMYQGFDLIASRDKTELNCLAIDFSVSSYDSAIMMYVENISLYEVVGICKRLERLTDRDLDIYCIGAFVYNKQTNGQYQISSEYL